MQASMRSVHLFRDNFVGGQHCCRHIGYSTEADFDVMGEMMENQKCGFRLNKHCSLFSLSSYIALY